MVVRDPIHGDVELSDLERRLVDTPEVQRLRAIRQTGTAHLVYPGCVHTRFDHSLGTLAVAKRILASLRRRGLSVTPADEAVVAAAALLHDVTHVPFGHTLEDERALFPRHDRGPRLERLLAGEAGRVLAGAGILEEVRWILRGRRGEEDRPLGPPWWRQVVSSTVDADLLDYLRRDSHFAGLAHSYDERVFSYFDLEGGCLLLDLSRHEMERPDAASEVLQLLRTRYFLTERVYFHHTKVCSGAMVAKAVELALEHGFREEDLLELGDETLLALLEAFPAGKPDPRVARLAGRVRRRRLLKRGYVVSAARVPARERRRLIARYHADRRARREAEEALAGELGLPFEDVVVYCPPYSTMKEATVPVRLGRGVVPLNARAGGAGGAGGFDTAAAGGAGGAGRAASGDGDGSRGGPARLLEVRTLEAQYAALWRFYVFVPSGCEAACARAAAELFGFPSEHAPPR